MANAVRMAIWLTLALLFVLVALWLEAGPITGGAGAGGAGAWLPIAGASPIVMLGIDALLALTPGFFLAALAAPHDRLAQGAALIGGGLVMAVARVMIALAGLATLAGLLALLLALLFASPFGAIAYFVKYGCGDAAMPALIDADCFDGNKALVATLALASWRFLTVKVLMITVALSAVFGVVIIVALSMLSGLPFLLHPLDAVLSIALGLAAAVVGAVTLVRGVAALALAIIGQTS